MKTYRVILNFTSILKLTTFIGLCYGIISIPIMFIGILISNPEAIEFSLYILGQLILGGLTHGIALSLILSIFGYPAYVIISKKTNGMVLKGKFKEENE